MTFDPARVPGGDVAAWGAECREKALDGVRAGDWRSIYDWTKSWITSGGGAWLPDTWLLYAVSALIQGKPRIGIHSLDLGLRTWLAGPSDRAALTWCRGVIVMRELADPKTALLDLDDIAAFLPAWTSPFACPCIERCRDAAAASRKQVRAVGPRPDFEGSRTYEHTVASKVDDRRDGERPEVWPTIEQFFLK